MTNFNKQTPPSAIRNIVYIRPILAYFVFALPSLLLDITLIQTGLIDIYLMTSVYYILQAGLQPWRIAELSVDMNNHFKITQLVVICITFIPTIIVTGNFGFLLLCSTLLYHGIAGYRSKKMKRKMLIRYAATLQLANQKGNLDAFIADYKAKDLPKLEYEFYSSGSIKYVGIWFNPMQLSTLEFEDDNKLTSNIHT